MLSSHNPLGKNDPYSLFENQIEKLGDFAKLMVRENDSLTQGRSLGIERDTRELKVTEFGHKLDVDSYRQQLVYRSRQNLHMI